MAQTCLKSGMHNGRAAVALPVEPPLVGAWQSSQNQQPRKHFRKGAASMRHNCENPWSFRRKAAGPCVGRFGFRWRSGDSPRTYGLSRAPMMATRTRAGRPVMLTPKLGRHLGNPRHCARRQPRRDRAGGRKMKNQRIISQKRTGPCLSSARLGAAPEADRTVAIHHLGRPDRRGLVDHGLRPPGTLQSRPMGDPALARTRSGQPMAAIRSYASWRPRRIFLLRKVVGDTPYLALKCFAR